MLFRAKTGKTCFFERKQGRYAFPSENVRLKFIRSLFNVIEVVETLKENHKIPNSLVGILRSGTDRFRGESAL